MTDTVTNLYKRLKMVEGATPQELFLYVLASHWNQALGDQTSLSEQCHRLACPAVLPVDHLSHEDLSVFDLIELFERLCCQTDRDKEGKFYTPVAVLEKMCGSLSLDTPKTVLDPACGAGAFLVYLAEKIFQQRTGTFAENIAVVNSSIFGVDKDSFAVTVCKELLTLSAFLHSTDKPRTSIAQITSIAHHDTLATISSKAELAQVFNSQLSNGVDLIIGNPPYGLSRGEKLSKEENARLKTQFSEYRFGKVNKYLVFMALATQLLSDQGTLRFIVPNAWLGLKTARYLRKKWCQEKTLTQVEILPASTFPTAKVEPVIFTYKKNTSAPDKVDIRNSTTGAHFSFPYQSWNSSPDFCIPTIWSDFSSTFFDACEKHCLLLGSVESPFTPYIALQAYATGKGSPLQTASDVRHHVFHTEDKLDDTCIPYMEGKDVQRFTHTWSGRYLRYGPWLAEFQPVERYSKPRVAVREILGKDSQLLSATYLEDPFVYNRSVLHVLGKNKDSQDLLLGLLAIFNSIVGSYIIKLRGRKSQRRLFPKLVNDDLRSFPIPNSFFEHAQSLSLLTQERIATKNPEIEQQINQRTIQLYGFSPEKLSDMEQLLQL